jgi:predicted AAA+ superfamily ATPase
MEKDLIKLLIAEYQQKVVEIAFQQRIYTIETSLNYVFTGLRRAGKSYMMFQQIHHLLETGHNKEEILYFNFEDDRISSFSSADLDRIKVCYEEMFDSKPVFFLDEIQIIDHWEKFARRLADQGYRVFITGSNAKMLSSEIATTLGGRYVIQYIYPFAFTEYLTGFGLDMADKNYIFHHRTKITKAYETYFRFGGLPELVKIADKRAWLSNLYQKIFLGDLITRYQIRNAFALQVLIRKLAESVKQPTSFNRLAHVVSSSGKKISTDTVIDYLDYLRESWLIFYIENIATKLADKIANKKYYFTDNGILNLFLFDPLTSLLENQVAIQLRRLYGEEVYYYHRNIEVDFYIPAQQLAVQVSYSLKDVQTRNREIHSLLKFSRQVDVSTMLIITKDEEETIIETGFTIKVLPVWKWLCDF